MTTSTAQKSLRPSNVTFKNSTWVHGTMRQNLNRTLNDKALDFPISNLIYDSEKYSFPFTQGYQASVTLKLGLVARNLDSSGISTIVYEQPKSGIAIMHQTRPDNQNFALVYSDLPTLINDAFGHWNFNQYAFDGIPSKFDKDVGGSLVADQAYRLLMARKAPPIMVITKGLFKDRCNFKYNEFLRNQPTGAAKLGHVKANRKILKYWQPNATEATFSIYTTGSVLHPIKLVHHERVKISSNKSDKHIEIDFFVLKTEDNNFFTLFTPNGKVKTETQYMGIGDQTKFHGIYPTYKKGNTADPVHKKINLLIEKHQALLNQ